MWSWNEKKNRIGRAARKDVVTLFLFFSLPIDSHFAHRILLSRSMFHYAHSHERSRSFSLSDLAASDRNIARVQRRNSGRGQKNREGKWMKKMRNLLAALHKYSQWIIQSEYHLISVVPRGRSMNNKSSRSAKKIPNFSAPLRCRLFSRTVQLIYMHKHIAIEYREKREEKSDSEQLSWMHFLPFFPPMHHAIIFPVHSLS